ncbi:murein transglycosylase A [Desulfoluna butyratoxydans]|uniref:peptidoglycan lytic exotransglycosylase n=1 Tax=Desulfoluna butyratoxydans TaxID=231438 RepID=A0A4U8YK74_9BACT|nr:MltA domain-containing protein [Desulfoluna butyratoxydans]VFQ43837.1 lytic transglycosylase mlta domain b [Desulfoluna butyratoxydans]
MMDAFKRTGARWWLVAAALVFLCFGCITTGKEKSKALPALVPVVPGEAGYPSFEDDLDFQGLEEALFRSLVYYNRIPKTRTFTVGEDRYSVSEMIRSAVALLYAIHEDPSPEAVAGFIRDNYRVYRSTGRDGKGEVLFTGYYEASLFGHTEETERYRYPVLSRPDDLVTIDISRFPGVKASGKRHLIGRVTEKGTVVPYYTRHEADNGSALLDRTEPLAWVDDPVDLFFLEIQGSGVITMENGEELRVHYQTKNGHPYRSIGRYMIRQGFLEREAVSMQSIRRWLEENPERRQEVFNYNPSMVFFMEEAKGPLGCYNVLVTPNRSIATDKRPFPACGIAFITTEKPGETRPDEVLSWESFGRFVMNQDTGGAIKGPGRVDLFTGHGEEAELTAGHMKQTGSLYFLVLKPSVR